MKKSFINLLLGLLVTALTEAMLEFAEAYLEKRRLKRIKRNELQAYKEAKLAEIRERRRELGVS